MDLQGEATIPAPPHEVWGALQDPEILKNCITGCQEMERISETQYQSKVRAKVGPVRATFSATIQMVDIDEPHSYTLQVEAMGGAAGFGRGSAQISLEDQGASTRLKYLVSGNVGGKLAQIGSRLITGVSNTMATQFFKNFVGLWNTQNDTHSQGESNG